MITPVSNYQLPTEWSLEACMRALGDAFPLDSDPDQGLVCTYFDTFDWRLYKGGELLRLEQEGRERHLIWSGLDDANPRQSLRNPERLPVFAPDLPPGALAERLGPLMAMRALLPVVEVKSRMVTLRVLDDEEKTVLRIALEEGQARAPGSAPWHPMGLALRLMPVRGYNEGLAEVKRFLRKKLGLRERPEGRLAAALAALGRKPLDYSTKLDFHFSPDERADAVARRIHLHLLDTIEANVPGVKAATDSEFLHDLRVAVRRTRSALTQIKGVFEEQDLERFKGRLAWIGAVTGPTRDMDVYLLGFDGYQNSLPKAFRKDLEPLREFLIAHQASEQQALVKRINSPHFRGLLKEWREFLEAPPQAPGAPKARKKIAKVAGRRIYRVYERVMIEGLMILPNTPAERLHKLRKECKKLRYLLEFFQSLYPKKKIKVLVKALKVLLDNLGEFQDYEVQALKLRELAHQMVAEGSVPADTLLAMGMLVDGLLRRQQQAREQFTECFAVFSGRQVSDLFETLFPHKPKPDLGELGAGS
ncbi:MAG: CHAD domain-containing protein [gamma proteobacterium symbiont of Phacoides pectinatus]